MSRFLELSTKLLNKNGINCTINNYTKNDFDTNLNKYVKTLTDNYESKFIFKAFNAGEYSNNINFEITDKQLLLLPIPNKYLNIDSEIVYEGKTFIIKNVDEIKDVDITVLYKLVVKEK